MQEENIMVSVLVITYNQASYIQAAIESILVQETQFPFEILVGDDMSTDGTQEILKRFSKNPHVQLYMREENLGASRNLYDLQKKANGKYIAYLEGDDLWDSVHKLQKQVEFLECHSQYIACTHKCKLVDESGRPTPNQCLEWISNRTIFSINDFHGIILPGHLSTLLHRNVFRDSSNRYEKLITLHPQISDRSLFLLLLSMGDIVQIPEIMSCYRQISSPSKHMTGVLYHFNQNCTLEDYQYTNQLQSYARDVLHVDGGFEFHKQDLFVSALCKWVRKPNEKQFKLIQQMFCKGNRIRYLFHIPIGVIKKTLYKFGGTLP